MEQHSCARSCLKLVADAATLHVSNELKSTWGHCFTAETPASVAPVNCWLEAKAATLWGVESRPERSMSKGKPHPETADLNSVSGPASAFSRFNICAAGRSYNFYCFNRKHPNRPAPPAAGRGFTQTRIYTTLDWTGMSLPPPNLTPCLPECLLGMASQTAWFWKLDSDEDWEPVHRWKRRTCRFLQPLLKDNMKAC